MEDFSVPEEVIPGASEVQERIRQLEAKLKKKIAILAPDDVDPDLYAEERLENLIEEEVERAEIGRETLVTDIMLLERAEKLLYKKIDQFFEDQEDEGDPEQTRRIRLFRIVDQERPLSSYEKDDKYLDARNLHNFLHHFNGGDELPLTTREIETLIDAGYLKVLTRSIYAGTELKHFFASIPEPLLLAFSREYDPYHKVENALDLAVAQGQKYSPRVLEQLLLHSYLPGVILKHASAFHELDAEQVIRTYDPVYPYNARQQIENAKKGGLDPQKLVPAIIKNNYITLEDRKVLLEADPTISVQFERLKGFKTQWGRFVSPEDMSPEELATQLKLAKEFIEDGLIGLLYEGRELLNILVRDEYDWLVAELALHDQEFFLREGAKPETQETYARKLLERNDALMLTRLCHGRDQRSAFVPQSLSPELFPQIKALVPAGDIRVDSFRGLSPEVYEECLREFGGDRWIFQFIQSFDFGDDPAYVEERAYQDFLRELLERGVIKHYDAYYLKYHPVLESVLGFSHFKIMPEVERDQWLDLMGAVEEALYSLAGQAAEQVRLALKTIKPPTYLIELPLEAKKDFFINLFGIYAMTVDSMVGYLLERGVTLDEMIRLRTSAQALEDYLRVGKIDMYQRREILVKGLTDKNPDETETYMIEIRQLMDEVSDEEIEVKLFYVRRFEGAKTSPEVRAAWVAEIKNNAHQLAQNQPIMVEDKDLYGISCRQVYPKRNYNSYKHEYEDRTSELDRFKFDRKGYKIALTGIVGYKIREGEEPNDVVLEKYASMVERAGAWARPGGLETMLEEYFKEDEGVPETLEGRILAYVVDKPDDLVATVLFAYQNRVDYEAFVHGTRDQLQLSVSEVEKRYIMLSELVEKFGDRLKETSKSILAAVLESPDQKLFMKGADEMVKGEDLVALGSKIKQDLEKIPADKLTDQVVKKKVVTAFKTRFQKIPELVLASEHIADGLDVSSLPSLTDELTLRVSEIMKDRSIGTIDTRRIESLQQTCFREIQIELAKYEEEAEQEVLKKELGVQEKSAKKRIVHGYFGKNKENAHARMVADICLAAEPTMLANPKYFEFVLFDEERDKNLGTAMLLEMEGPDGKKYLLFCPNPSVDLVSKVSADKLYVWVLSRVADFAKENDFEAVLVSTIHGWGTNRPGKFQIAHENAVLKDKDGKERRIDLERAHTLSGNYIYKSNLGVVWSR